MSDIDKCISVLIKLSKSFGIDAKTIPSHFNHIIVSFEKKTCDGTPWRLNYAFELWLLKDLDTCQLQEYFKYAKPNALETIFVHEMGNIDLGTKITHSCLN